MRTPIRRTVVATVAAVGALLTLGPARPVAAHASLETSTPAANAVLSEAPPFVVLDFDETVEVGLAVIDLYDGAGEPVALGEPERGADSSQVRAAVADLADGLYAVVWRVTSIDGHSVRGSFAFHIGTATGGDADALLASVGSGAASSGVAWQYGIARSLSLAGFVLVVGLGWWSLARPALLWTQRRIRRLLAAAATAMVVGSLGAFAFFAAQVTDGSVASAFSPAAWGDAAGTTTGRMLLLRVVAAAGLATLLAIPLRRTTAPGSRALWGAGAAAALATMSFSASGHPNSVSPQAVWIAVDVVHLAGVVAWIGGLVALLAASRVSQATPEVQGLALRYSGAATVAVPIVVATGVAQTWRLAGGLDDVSATTWGRLLLVKVTVVVAVVAIAGVSRWLLQREGVQSIRRTVAVEVVAAVVAGALAMAMVAQPPRPAAAVQPYEGTLTSGGVIAAVSLSPGRVGSNEVHILITPPGGSLTRVEGATARVSLPAAGVPISPATLVPDGPNHYVGAVTFTQPGEWTLEIVVQVSASSTVLLKATVPIP